MNKIIRDIEHEREILQLLAGAKEDEKKEADKIQVENDQAQNEELPEESQESGGSEELQESQE